MFSPSLNDNRIIELFGKLDEFLGENEDLTVHREVTKLIYSAVSNMVIKHAVRIADGPDKEKRVDTR